MAAKAFLPNGEVLYFPQSSPVQVREAITEWVANAGTVHTVAFNDLAGPETWSTVINWPAIGLVRIVGGDDPEITPAWSIFKSWQLYVDQTDQGYAFRAEKAPREVWEARDEHNQRARLTGDYPY